VELTYGLADSERPPLIVTLADGRSVAFRGRIDRVDRAPDGRRVVVLDYKSGSAFGYDRLDTDPVRGGRLLQLPVYGLAAQGEATDVGAYYWFVSEQRDYVRHGYPLTDETLARFRAALGVIVDGIGGGLFPARPGTYDQGAFDNCRFCPYDRVCPRERGRIWKSKRWAPQLRAYLDLAEPEG
jgi:RecB family exonuclease